MKETGGNWQKDRWPVYFLAIGMFMVPAIPERCDDLLVPVNDITGDDGHEGMAELVRQKKNLLLDSGVYWLATQHAERNGLSMNEALSLAPDKVDGFDKLFSSYVDIVRRYEGSWWGYIELDQGGLENKRKTRRRLEAMGLAPIPVYHPINDGWDYFDELAQEYDRICLGNVVMASAGMRKRLLATIWERRRKYPHLWVHALGMTPSDLLVAYPMSSCDSSSWYSAVRWARYNVASAGKPMGQLVDGFVYSRGHDVDGDRGHRKARKLCAYDAMMAGLTMRNMRGDVERELGADVVLPERHS
jgi:hypothetical protein